MAVTSNLRRDEPHDVIGSNAQVFLQPDFDPADYLNSALPALATAANARTGQLYGRSVPLLELSSQLSALLTQLNGQVTRLSHTLTQLTDEIVRSGGRLAYEVDMLKGETTGLTDLLESGLKSELSLFTEPASEPAADDSPHEGETAAAATTEPDYLPRLRTLTLVRARLDAVINVFGDAMAWPLAPSETASLLSISAPEHDAEIRSREQKGKEYIENLRAEINDLVGSGDDLDGLEAAAARLERLGQLAEVWKGTAEEKARLKIVEGLAHPVRERIKVLEKSGATKKADRHAPEQKGYDFRYGDMEATRLMSGGGYGIM